VIIKKVREGQNSDTIVLMTCPPTNIIKDQVKEEKSLGLGRDAIKNVKHLFRVARGKTSVSDTFGGVVSRKQ